MIEGTPQVSEVSVNPGESNTTEITGDNVEDIVPGEGKVYYDIRFRAWTPDRRESIQLIIDLEAQKKYYPGYNIITRGIFYCARMISAQMGTEFTGNDYDKIKKVYSIWICMDCPKYAENTITEYSVGQNNIVGDFPSDKGRYDLLFLKKLIERKNVPKLFYCWEFPHIWISISRKLSNTLQMAEMTEDLMRHILLKHRILN